MLNERFEQELAIAYDDNNGIYIVCIQFFFVADINIRSRSRSRIRRSFRESRQQIVKRVE